MVEHLSVYVSLGSIPSANKRKSKTNKLKTRHIPCLLGPVESMMTRTWDFNDQERRISAIALSSCPPKFLSTYHCLSNCQGHLGITEKVGGSRKIVRSRGSGASHELYHFCIREAAPIKDQWHEHLNLSWRWAMQDSLTWMGENPKTQLDTKSYRQLRRAESRRDTPPF